ncbi:MAG: PrsW family glutamic-type intramembrane protease [Flavobacteriaceae bacterium]
MAILLVPLSIVNLTPLESRYHLSSSYFEENNYIYAIAISFLICAVWLIYIIRLDIFNSEKKRNILLTLLLSIVLTLFTEYPYLWIHSLGFIDSVEPLQSIIYSIFGIGLIEETIKFIPLFIILKLTKAIDEPYDYILYASVSALGFSFVENALYLNASGLHIINARALYATVAHMTFSSMIGYGLFLIKFKHTSYPNIVVFIVFFFFAIFSHGFYDFWLINPTVANLNGLTTLFFLITIHIWFSIKNNTINTSNYYDATKKIDNDALKIYLIISLLSIFMLSYVYVAFTENSKEANIFFVKSALVYGYIIFYLIATLTKYNMVKGLLKPFTFTLRFLIPKIRK